MRWWWLLLAGCGTAPVTEDAGTDAGVVPSFCFTRPSLTFCEDFDGEFPPGAFDEVRVNGGSFALADGQTTSAPKALVVQSGGEASFIKSFTPALTYKAFLQFQLEQVPASGEAELFAIDLDGTHRVGMKADSQARLHAFADGTDLGSCDAGSWSSVRFDVTGDGGSRVLTLKVGEVSVLTRAPLPSTGAGEAPVFSVGFPGGTPAGFTVRYDTVTFISQ